MKLTIFGATGKIGQHVVNQALAENHTVTAFARDISKIKLAHENLKTVEGDVLNLDDIKTAITGSDAVICALGMPLMNKDMLRTKGTKNIVDAMQLLGVGRLVCLSAIGIGDSYSILPFHYKYLIFPLFFRHLAPDHEAQENLVRKSDMDWVIVRPGNFVKGQHTGEYRHGVKFSGKSLKLKISHADVADFLVGQLTQNDYLYKSPAISY